jgi:sulfide:quinone oxidoreductase
MGARRVPAFAEAATFRGQEDSEAVHGLIQDLEGGYLRRIAFVVPPGVAWPLPIYELALMAAERASAMSLDDVELTVVTPEDEPLGIFGHEASDAVRLCLEKAGVRIEASTTAEVVDARTVALRPGGRVVECDRVVALPRIEAIRMPGVPATHDGFIPADAHGRVAGAPDVFAAGDGTSFPVKQGGVACQQADAAAEAIAHDTGAPLDPQPFRPVLRGELLTGGRPLYMRSDISGTAGDQSETSGHTLWWPPAKIAGAYLAPYLVSRAEQTVDRRVAPAARRVAAPTEPPQPGHGIELLGFDLREPEYR